MNKVIDVLSTNSSNDEGSRLEGTDMLSKGLLELSNSESPTSSSRKRKSTLFPHPVDMLRSFDEANNIDMQDNFKSIPVKRRKSGTSTMMSRSLSRSSKSYMSIVAAGNPSSSESIKSNSNTKSSSASNKSLLFQLHYVSSDDGTQGSRSSNSSAEHIPCILTKHQGLGATSATVDGSRNNTAHDSVEKSFYGWFVELDKDDDEHNQNHKELAFSAITAPKKNIDLDKEVDWACAADTVDDVLGDFF